MRKKNFKGRCEKRNLGKCKGICKTYDRLQSAYADILQNDDDIIEIRCNVSVDEEYTTDFVCVKTNQELMVRECVNRNHLVKPMTVKLLDISREFWLNSIIDKLSKMLVGEELHEKSLALPDYDDSIRLQDDGTRLIALSNLYSIYIPSDMSAEIYCKLYLALVRSLQKKNTADTIRQLNENYRMMQKQAHNGIIGGSDCFTITGCSGIGKSSAIYRAIDLIGINGVVETQSPYRALKNTLLRSGDVLVIKSLDRLSRNKEDIKQELEWFKSQRIRLKILDLPTTLIDYNGQEWIFEMVNNILIEVISSLSQYERENIRKRQAEGIEAARKMGKHLGRPKLELPENADEILEAWKSRKITARYAMEQLGMGSSAFYNLVKERGIQKVEFFKEKERNQAPLNT